MKKAERTPYIICIRKSFENNMVDTNHNANEKEPKRINVALNLSYPLDTI
ncbi:MAG: hypothetical protein QXQ32_00705 [Candidatus Methanomethylicia archaeon]